MGTIQILDGGLGTSLEDTYSVTFDHSKPLWSTHFLVEGEETLLSCQRDFAGVGVDILLTATYQTSIEGFSRTKTVDHPNGISKTAIGPYLQKAVEIVETARVHDYTKFALSLGPYGACMIPGQEYSGDYDSAHSSEESLYCWHLERLQLFTKVEGLIKRVQYVALETIPRLDEIRAVRKAIKRSGIDLPFWITCVFPGEDLSLPDGSSVDQVVKAMVERTEDGAAPWGVGLNCTKLHKLPALVEAFEQSLQGLIDAGYLQSVPTLMLYPDGTQGEVYNTTTKTWEIVEGQESNSRGDSSWAAQLANIVKESQDRGCFQNFVVGGCCVGGFWNVLARSGIFGLTLRTHRTVPYPTTLLTGTSALTMMNRTQSPPTMETVSDIEKNPSLTADEKSDLAPQLNIGGHGATQRRLKDYQVTMIGICSGIGTGLFIGTGSAYAKAGPAGLLLAYTVVGAVLWCVMQSIAELATLIPTAGSFPHWATRFIDPAVGFSLAISYGYCFMIAIASECSAAAILVSYWTDMSPAVVITVSLVLILMINLLSVRFFGEAEVITGSIKVACFLGLVIVSIVITAGGGPNHEGIGFRYWHAPGAWTNYRGITGSTGHFLGFLSAFVNASFSFIGVETVVITAAESVNPHRAIPKAASRVTWRIGIFYILGALLISLIVDPTNENLVSGSGNANSSPWVIAIRTAGIDILPSIVNACILVSAWSAGSSYCWVGSRMIVAMTTDRQLPQVFGRVTKNGVPWVAVIVAWLFGLLAYLSLGTGGAAQAFTWLLSLSTVGGLIAWATLCFCYIRFHRALTVQAVSRDSLPWKGPFQPYAAWVGFIGSSIITLITGFPVFLDGNWDTSNFVASYVGIPIFVVPIIAWKIWKKTKFVRAKDVDLWSGRL
ncbi:hypothetical protein JX265_011578 [Neoarthrinium moseri]|uniref:Hcy-binding domain-containing protein n=1 Tax=Neoarthrinium moseri TaxID=1658444 RepID=A0A9P9WC02_9PEZI|nr:hypothetical protein JX265_011578 [Neoarthrinium moseri]